MKTIVFYHANCLDGFAGAWAAWKKLKGNAEYHGLKHEEECMPRGIRGRDIIFVDFCLSEKLMRKVGRLARSLTVIDHHISHKDAVACADSAIFDLKKSGCVLAWEYFHPTEKLPQLLLAIQDFDLFILKRAHTLEYATMLTLFEFEFQEWDRLAKRFEILEERKMCESLGAMLLRYKDTFVDRLIEIVMPVEFHGIKAYAVNTHVFYSEVGAAIYQRLGVPLGIAWYYKDGRIKVSLRSDGSVNCAEIAARYGGGGHVGAAGFWIDFTGIFPWNIRQKKKNG